MERDWEAETGSYLKERFAELWAALGQPLPIPGLRISPPPGLIESEYFLRGLESELFWIDEFGQFHSELLPAPRRDDGRGVQLFQHEPQPRLLREVVCQLSTASALILKRGWLRSQVVMLSGDEELRPPGHGIDLLVRSRPDEILICVEVKRSAAELQKLMTDMGACCKRGPHARDECGFPQNHAKYEFCALNQPAYFWAVAPDADVCLRMNYDGDVVGLEQISSLPPRSMIE
ncbi:MAG: hypothetical protein QOH88_976 [Verrucomicrobiota bacterium]|jgi:hypothetical protein